MRQNIAIVLVMMLVGAAGLTAAEAKEPPPAARPSIEEALQKPVSFTFVDTPLQDCVQFFQSLTGANIVIDRATLERARIDPRRPVSLRLKGLPAHRGLALLARTAGLTCTILDNDHVAISVSAEALQRAEAEMGESIGQLVLTSPGGHFRVELNLRRGDVPGDLIRQAAALLIRRQLGLPTPTARGPAVRVFRLGPEGGIRFPPQAVIDLLQKAVGEMNYQFHEPTGCLIVRGPAGRMEKVERVLEALGPRPEEAPEEPNHREGEPDREKEL